MKEILQAFLKGSITTLSAMPWPANCHYHMGRAIKHLEEALEELDEYSPGYSEQSDGTFVDNEWQAYVLTPPPRPSRPPLFPRPKVVDDLTEDPNERS